MDYRTLEEQLKAIEERAEKATPGPWKQTTIGVVVDAKAEEMICSTSGRLGTDDRFIAHAREDIPLLLSMIRKLREQRDNCYRGLIKNEHPRYQGDLFVKHQERTDAELAKLLGGGE